MKKKVVASLIIFVILIIGVLIFVFNNIIMAAQKDLLDGNYDYTIAQFTSLTTPNSKSQTGKEFTAGSYVPYSEYEKTIQYFCAQHGQRLTDYANTEVTIGGVSLGQIPFPEEGQTIQLSGDPGASSTTSESLCRYDNVETKTAGVDGDWAIAYVLNQFPKNTDHKSGEVQNAFWAILGQAEMNDLAQEAKAFQEYKERLQKSGGFKGSYKFDLSTVSFDNVSDQIIVGPLSLKYERGFAKIGNREKVNFGGIKDIKIFDQNGKEVDKSIWKITYDAEHKDSKKERLAGDEDYGTTGSEFYSYPYSEEAFNIVLNATKCKEKKITKISKVQVTFYDLDITAEYQDISGIYREANWQLEYDSYMCEAQERHEEKYTDMNGNEYTYEYVEPCKHGYTTAHQQNENFRLVAHVRDLNPQKLVVVMKTDEKNREGIIEITPKKTTTTIPPVTPPSKTPGIPSIIVTTPTWPTNPTTPTWPTWPSYPDWPDHNDDDDDDNPGGDNPGGDNPGGENPGGENPGGENPGGENPGGENPGGDNPGGDNPGGDNPGGDNPGGDNPGGDNPGGDNPGGDNPGEEVPDLSLTIRLSGIVWEDTQTGKESEYDGVIGYQNDGTQEKGVPKVKVTLYKAGTKELAEAKQNPVYTNDGGEYYFTRVPMGKYEVEFEYDGMTYTTTQPFASGSVEEYKNNPDDTKYVKDSKTEETQADRQNFNNKFYEISGDSSTASTNGKTYGTARDANGNKTVDLEYTTQNGVSKLITTDSNGYVKPEFAITASTATMGLAYPFQERYTNSEEDKLIDNNVYETTYKYMYYINLGLKKRPEADIAVSKDVSTATVTINKKQMTYKYNARAGLDGFDITVKNSPSYSNIYYNREIYKSDYNYRIDDYKNNTLNVSGSEVQATKSEDQELKTFVTYKMTIRNQSGIPAVTANEIVDYYDNDYKLVTDDVHLDIQEADGTEVKGKVVARKSYYETSNGQSGEINWKETGKYQTDTDKAGTDLNVIYTTDLQDVVLQSGEDAYIYVTFEVDKDGNRAVRLGEKSNFIEINSFSTFESGTGKNSPTGQADRDSAPGNLNPYDTTTKEDDSDSAPTINIKLAEGVERTLNGIVWEDARTKELSTGQVVGDGLRQNDEKAINGVTVQLIELVDAGNGKQYEYIWQEMSTGEGGYQYVNSDGKVLSGQTGKVVNGSVRTDKGEYYFKNYIPGNYIVRFKYGDTEKTLLSKINGKSYNGHDYKSTAYQGGENINQEWYDLSNKDLMDSNVSDAKDNEARRLQVINYSKVMKFNIADVLYSVENEKQELYKDFRENTFMYADTAKLKIQVEYDKTEANGSDNFDYNVRNMDFGIENRPANDIELDKEIVGIKITLSNGTSIIDTENGINKNVNWVSNTDKLQGKIHIYMDEEIMQGANVQVKYRITVKNKGEVDSIGATDSSVGETYYTGKTSTSDRVVTTSVDKIIDYVDNSLVFKADLNPDWKLIENTELKSISEMKKNGYLDNSLSVVYKDASNKDKAITQIIVSEALADDPLEPGQSASVDLVLTKTISSADEDDDLSYNNVAETIQFTNLVGRKDNIPGNKKPYEFEPDENDSDYTEEIIITPPTGGNKSMTYVFIAVIVLVVAGGVMFIIRKFKK